MHSGRQIAAPCAATTPTHTTMASVKGHTDVARERAKDARSLRVIAAWLDEDLMRLGEWPVSVAAAVGPQASGEDVAAYLLYLAGVVQRAGLTEAMRALHANDRDVLDQYSVHGDPDEGRPARMEAAGVPFVRDPDAVAGELMRRAVESEADAQTDE